MKRRLGSLALLGLGLGLALLLASYLLTRGRLKLPIGQHAPAISLGFSHGLILASDGSLWVWGDQELGWPVLGLGRISTQRRLHRLGRETNWVSISAGIYHNFAVKRDGTLWSWGGNFQSQLGDDTKLNRNTPVQVLPGNDWRQAAAGGASSVALKKDGTLWTWGANWCGQLGLGTWSNTIVTASQVGTNTNWTRIWAGGIQTVAQQSDGSLWFCGSLMGSSPDTNQFAVPTRVSPDTNWVDVCFSYFTVLALKSDGTLWAWGREANAYTGGEQEIELTPRRIGTNEDWVVCASIDNRQPLLMSKDGTLWELQVLDGGKRPLPAGGAPVKFKRIDLAKPVAAFAAGRGGIGVVLTPEGEVWTWGPVFGARPIWYRAREFCAQVANRLGLKAGGPEPGNVIIRTKPWQLRNEDSSQAATE